MRFFKQIWRGAGYLEGFGHHPGIETLAMILFLCGIAGAQKGGMTGFFGGMGIGAIFILPFFITGCISRANACDEAQRQLLNKIKNS